MRNSGNEGWGKKGARLGSGELSWSDGSGSGERNPRKEDILILRALAYLVKEFGLCFAGKREPMKVSGQGSDILVAVHEIDSSGSNVQ